MNIEVVNSPIESLELHKDTSVGNVDPVDAHSESHAWLNLLPTLITDEMRAAALKVLLIAPTHDDTPQKMLDAMLAVTVTASLPKAGEASIDGQETSLDPPEFYLPFFPYKEEQVEFVFVYHPSSSINQVNPATSEHPLKSVIAKTVTTKITAAVRDVMIERRRQDDKWGGSAIEDQKKLPTDWCQDVAAYASWALQMHRMGSPEKYRRRMMQTAALAIAAVESFDRLEAAKKGVA